METTYHARVRTLFSQGNVGRLRMHLLRPISQIQAFVDVDIVNVDDQVELTGSVFNDLSSVRAD